LIQRELLVRRCLSLAVVVILYAAPAAALDLPTRKPGLWEIKMTPMLSETAMLPPVTAEHCIDAETDRLMNITGGSMQPEMCSKQDVQKEGSTFVANSVCEMGPMKMRWRAVLSGDFNSAYTVKTTMKQDGKPVQGIPAEDAMTIDAKWIGACKPDQKPGDMIMAGRKTNVRDLQNVPGRPSPAPKR
jgi:hypothetical protein